jgi:hypothetical protein
VDLPEDYPAHPDTVLLENKFYPAGLNEYQVWRQHQNHLVDLTKQLLRHRTLLVIKAKDRVVIRRNTDEGGALEIRNKDDVRRLISGRAMEFHIVADKMTDVAWIDLDPKERFPFDRVKTIATDLQPILQDVAGSEVTLKFSGGRGFHLLSWLTEKRDIDELRNALRERLDEYVEQTGQDKLSTGVVREDDMMRLDVSTLHESGSIRAAWSFHSATGLLSIPLTPDDLQAFKKEDARINLPRGLEFVPFTEDPNSTSGQMRWRQRDPDGFQSVLTWKFWKGIHAPGLSFIAGPLKHPMGEDSIQAVRFNREDWTPAKAAKWWEENYVHFDKTWTAEDWEKQQ